MEELFHLPGPNFLKFYVGLWAGLLLLIRLGSWALTRVLQPEQPSRKLDLFEAAYLHGGLPGVVTTAMTSLQTSMRSGRARPSRNSANVISSAAPAVSAVFDGSAVAVAPSPTP